MPTPTHSLFIPPELVEAATVTYADGTTIIVTTTAASAL